MNPVDQFLARGRRDPRFVCTTTISDLCNNHELLWIRVERTLNELIGHMRTVEVTCIEVVHTRLYGFSQNPNCRLWITWWSPHLRPRKLHGTVPHTIQGDRGAWEREFAGEVSRSEEHTSELQSH